MDFSKIKKNKAMQIALIIALPTALVGAYFGYKYIKRKSDEKNKKRLDEAMRKKYEKISSVDDFFEGIKYLEEQEQFGYKFNLLPNKRKEIEDMPFDILQRLYKLMQIPHAVKTAEQQEEFLTLIRYIYP